ncbi:MAG: 50S ribosomal protein L21 [Wolbachia endosymbiont of Menacanthus eurysternus]|nr:MAG: 50S ribosomal protein L21 [Wolbachia endosymbiont of Menacanthus eurysternus]
MFAVIETGGKQYLVKEGSILKVERLNAEEGKEVKIDKIIYFSGSGLSCLPNIAVEACVLEQCKGKKILVFKKKRRKNYRRKIAHRQCITVLRINKINIQN